MKVIVGLGNPGREYEHTRHNVGWWVVDHLADVWRFDAFRRDGEAHVSTGLVGTTKVRLVKPQTYMNLSGAVLTPYLRRPFWSARLDLLVVVDEVALPLGQAFHQRRLTLRSSQVGSVASAQRARWDHCRRLALALSLLGDPVLDILITGEDAFAELPRVQARLAQDPGDALMHRIRYD